MILSKTPTSKRGRYFTCGKGSWTDLNSGRQSGHAVFFIANA